jgi:hypothetical protein
MKLIIFGATGMVGKQLVQQALFNKHQVKAFGRNVFTTDYLQTENLELIQGALFDEKEVFNALSGCDAVLSSIGGSVDGTDKARTLGMKNIINQMKRANVHRIIAIGGLGVLNADETTLLIEKEDYPKEFLPVGLEHKKVYELLQQSGLNWTLVCPPHIIDEAPTGKFITRADYPPVPNHFKINAGDLALMMLKELDHPAYIQQRVGISN